MKDQLLFDITDANTRADTDQIGAVIQGVRSGSKELINSQQINSQEWLNTVSVLYDENGAVINDSNPLPVDVTGGVNVEVDLSHVDDSVALGNGTSLLTSTTVSSDIGLDVYLINSNISVTQGTDPWVVSATDLDIRDLDAGQDNVAISDGTDDLDINSDGSINVKKAAFSNIANGVTTLTAAGTAQDIVASPTANRAELWVYNNSNRRVFVGASGVTTSNGFPIAPRSYLQLGLGSSVDIEFDGGVNGQELRYLELIA